jgi:hypothetical protein
MKKQQAPGITGRKCEVMGEMRDWQRDAPGTRRRDARATGL